MNFYEAEEKVLVLVDQTYSKWLGSATLDSNFCFFNYLTYLSNKKGLVELFFLA